MKVCGNCGTTWDDTAKICGNCGTPLAVQEAVPTCTAFEPMEPAPVKQGAGKKLIAIIAAAALAMSRKSAWRCIFPLSNRLCNCCTVIVVAES